MLQALTDAREKDRPSGVQDAFASFTYSHLAHDPFFKSLCAPSASHSQHGVAFYLGFRAILFRLLEMASKAVDSSLIVSPRTPS